MSGAGAIAAPPGMGGLRGKWTADFPMSSLSSWHAGGAAEWLYEPADVDDLRALVAAAGDSSPLLFVGRGTNLLVRDGGIDGIAVRCDAALGWVRVGEGGAVEAGAGAPCPKVAKFAADRDLRGGEFLCGIPGSIGGALAMNAGCHGSEIWDVVAEARAIGPGGEIARRTREDFAVGYRSVEPRGEGFALFVSASLALERGAKGEARKAMGAMMAARRRTQPLTLPNSGSVFRNPGGDSAGRLIEECGIKGLRAGGAEISEKHANFIVNRGGASAADIEALIGRAREAVMDRAGVELELEVRIVGRPA